MAKIRFGTFQHRDVQEALPRVARVLRDPRSPLTGARKDLAKVLAAAEGLRLREGFVEVDNIIFSAGDDPEAALASLRARLRAQDTGAKRITGGEAGDAEMATLEAGTPDGAQAVRAREMAENLDLPNEAIFSAYQDIFGPRP